MLAAILDEGDLSALVLALEAEPELANTAVAEGEHAPHPIHAVCDRVFDGRLEEDTALPLVDALIEAGAHLDHVHAANGDGLLASALSLSCPQIAKRLLEAGAPFDRTGLFGALPIHWAAIMGMADLVEDLLARGSDFLLREPKFDSTPLGWAIEGWASPPKGSKGQQIKCAARLVEAGAIVEPQWRSSERICKDEALSLALGLN